MSTMDDDYYVEDIFDQDDSQDQTQFLENFESSTDTTNEKLMPAIKKAAQYLMAAEGSKTISVEMFKRWTKAFGPFEDEDAEDIGLIVQKLEKFFEGDRANCFYPNTKNPFKDEKKGYFYRYSGSDDAIVLVVHGDKTSQFKIFNDYKGGWKNAEGNEVDLVEFEKKHCGGAKPISRTTAKGEGEKSANQHQSYAANFDV